MKKLLKNFTAKEITFGTLELFEKPYWRFLTKLTAENLQSSLHHFMLKALGAKLCSLETPEGVISYYVAGNPKKLPLLYLHGFADNKYSFFNSAFYLKNHFYLIAADLPGFGQSFRKKTVNYTKANYVRWFNLLLDHENIESAHIAGNSLGGALALAIALETPKRLKSLALIDAAGVYLEDSHSFYTDLSDGHNIFDINSYQEFELFLKRIFHRMPFIPWAIKTSMYFEMIERKDWHNFMIEQISDGVVHIDDPQIKEKIFNHRLREITLPTLIIWGRADAFFPYQTAYLIHREIKDSKLLILDHVGHAPQIEAPKLFSRRYLQFIQEISTHDASKDDRSSSAK